VLTVTSGLGPLRNRWSLLNYNMLMFLLFILHITWSYVDSGLKTTWCYSYAKTLSTKSYMQLNPCHAFWASWTPCYACWVRHRLTLAISHISGRVPDCKVLELLGLWSTSQFDPRVKVTPGVRSCLSAVLLSKVISYTIALCLISICLLMLHLSASICEIWHLYFTYSVYLVLSLKPDVTVWS
jgi:hypothetical protein